jgi:hypothetical protein
MAPEQVRAQPLDRRCDVWSAGVIAWELFAGRRLHDTNSDPAALLLRIATEPVARLSTVRPDIPPAVDEAIAWALAHDRARRCPTAEQFRDRLLKAWGDRAGPADSSEVAQHVQLVAGAELEERRARVRSEPETKALAASSAGSASVASGPRSGFEDLPLDQEASKLAAGLGMSAVTSATEGSLVSSAGPGVVPRRRWRPWVVAIEVAVVGGAVAVLALGARRVNGSSILPSTPAMTAVSASASPPSPEPAAPPTGTAALATDSMPDASPVAPSSALPPPASDNRASTTRPPGPALAPARRPSQRSSHPKEPGSVEPPLAKSPYE